jgi:predicted metal-dependent phosphoesterase TrpH
MGIADLHVHSTWSDGMASVREIMAYAEERTQLDVIAIADHDQVRGALEAVEWCAGRPRCRVQAIVATEISAAWGRHLLAFFFQEPYPTRPFPRHRSVRRTIQLVEDAGGVVAIPHPLSVLVPSIGERALEGLLGGVAGLTAVHAVEVCSRVVGGRRAEGRLRRLNDTVWGLASLGNSDAHHIQQIGSAFTSFPGRSVAELQRAILERTTLAHWGETPQVSVLDHARQNWRSLVVKPIRELRAVLGGEAVTPLSTAARS